jgi:hypothetical protein
MIYENETQNVSFGNAILAALMSGKKYDVITQNSLKIIGHGNHDNTLESPCTNHCALKG